MAHHIFSPITAIGRGVTNTLEAGNPHMKTHGVVVQIRAAAATRGLRSVFLQGEPRRKKQRGRGTNGNRWTNDCNAQTGWGGLAG